MKLILCPHCGDVVKLTIRVPRFCECGKSWGQYHKDGLNADIGGEAIPLGFANQSFIKALKDRPEEGEGSRFEAFVIPKKASSMHKKKDAPRPLKTWVASLWGTMMIFVAPTHAEVVEHILEKGYVEGIGPVDLGEHIWELPSGGYPENKVTLICKGKRE